MHDIFVELKKRPFLFGTIILFLVLSLMGMVLHFRATASTIINTMFAVLVFLGGALFLYYLTYRWVLPALAETRFHQQVTVVLSATMLGSAVSVWFVQNHTIPYKFLEFANSILPATVIDSKPIDAYKAYFPFIIFVGMSIILGLVFYRMLTLVLQISKYDIRAHIAKRMLLIAYGMMILSVTSCIFSTDSLEIGLGQQSIIFYGGTEDYINYRTMNIDLSFWDDLKQYGGFMYGKNSLGDFQIYLSSTGFYGTLIKLGQQITQIPPDKFLKASRLLFGIIMAGMLTIFSMEIKKQYGFLTSSLFSIFPVITYWFIGPSTHLIWFYFILFIPFFASLYFYPRVLAGKMTRRNFLIIIFITELLVFLKGYTYTPVLILSAAIPTFFHDLQAKRHFKDVLWNGVTICLTGTGAFFVVLVIHFFQLWLYTGSVSQAKEYLVGRAIVRGASGDTNLQTPMEIFRNWLNVRVFYISKRVFAIFPQWQEYFDQFNTFGNFHIMALISVGISCVLYTLQYFGIIRNQKIKPEIDTLFTMSLTTLAAMLSSWSWFPALGHMSHHYHMNGIMYMLPFGLCLFVLVALNVQTLFHWMAIHEN